MCGIIGYTGNQDAVPIIIDGLKRLEYRGYDSAGLAVPDGDKITVVKQKGRIARLEEELARLSLLGSTAIGHTRWATHGEPSDQNSHPHTGSRRDIAIVHNGIIENYKTLKDFLEKQGVTFMSETDSEIVAQLAEYYYKGDLMEAVIKVIDALEGSYALGIMCAAEPGKIIAVKKDNPLIAGVSAAGSLIASDIPAILKYTSDIYYPADKEIVVLTQGGISFYNTQGEPIAKTPEHINWNRESAEKDGYEHFMFKEIMQQPKVMQETVNSLISKKGINAGALQGIDITAFNRIVITACGSAYNAGMVGKYVFERLLRMPVEVELASEFRYKDAIADGKTLVILISQSGETADTIAAMREAKSKGAKTLAIVNVRGSTIAKEADTALFTLAGPEIAVATTKALAAQLVTLYVIAVRFAVARGLLSAHAEAEMTAEIQSLAGLCGGLLERVTSIRQYADASFKSKSIFFIGRNIDYAIAMEGSLKLKEISYIHSEAYAGGELKHGTISLIEENTLVVAVSCRSDLYAKMESNVEQVIARGANVLLITDNPLAKNSDRLTVFNVPRVNHLFSPSLSVIVLQLLAYYVAANKGCDIDKPRHLAKSVTVE